MSSYKAYRFFFFLTAYYVLGTVGDVEQVGDLVQDLTKIT